MGICESWLQPHIPNPTIINTDQFTLFRKDRPTRGGGVCVVVRNSSDVNANQVIVPSKFDSIEILVVDIECTGYASMRFIVCYCPPLAHKLKDYSRSLIGALSFAMNTSANCCLVGDFNLPDIDWINKFYPKSDFYVHFEDFVNSYALCQMVNFPNEKETY